MARNRKNEGLVEDPHELLLSLVDMGSLDSDEVLLACVTEMSDAECKRVLNSLSLPACCDDVEDDSDEDDFDLEEPEEDEDDLDPVADEIVDLDAEDDDSDEADDTEEDEDDESELEARIRRLEKSLHSESMNRNRIRRFPRRRTNR